MTTRGLIFASVLFFSLVLLPQSMMASAHNPGGVSLEYDSGTDTLTVTVSHSVDDPNTHYIYRIVVEKNSIEVASRDYTSQDSTSGTSDAFTLAAIDGDVLEATAYCSISGQNSAQITVSIATTTETTTTTPSDTITTTTTDDSGEIPLPMTAIIVIAILALGTIALIIALVLHR
ncbi:MAG: hypothetical protein ACFE7R_05165 [Candidatus Hodarchaeota archaeon]